MPKTRFETRALYLQVRDELVRRIAVGEWKPGAPLPNEIELAKQLSVSMGTARKALDLMEDERIVTRQQGRGTFVNDQAGLELAARFANVRDASGERVEGLVANPSQVESGQGTQEEIERLELEEDVGVIRVRRVLQHDGRPFMSESAVLPSALYKTLPADMGDYRIAALAQANGFIPGRADEKITIVPADAADAAALAVQEGAALMQLDRVVLSVDGRPLEWRIARCDLSDKYYRANM